MTTIYRGTVLFAGGGETVEGSTVDVRGAGEVKLGVLGSDIETVHRAELRTIVTRPDPKDPGVFEESGKITVDDMGSIFIETLEPGGDGPAVDPGWIRGYAVFRITGGDGAFDGASGYVTTNFSLDPDGLMYDSESLMVTVP